jgi:predicted transcriptional regulator
VRVSTATISRIETGHQTPSLGIVARLVEFSAGFAGAVLTADEFLVRGRRTDR